MATPQPYPSDMTEGQWKTIEKYIPVYKTGRKRTHSIRDIINAIFYLVREGCRWRAIPHDFPNWSVVKYYFYCWRDDGTWEAINVAMVQEVRGSEGRDPEPSAGIMDSKTIKTTELNEDPGFDGNKYIKGTKIQILVDVLGLLLKVKVHPANMYDGDGAKQLFKIKKGEWRKLKRIWADSGYRGKLRNWLKKEMGITLEIVTSFKAKAKPKNTKAVDTSHLQMELFTSLVPKKVYLNTILPSLCLFLTFENKLWLKLAMPAFQLSSRVFHYSMMRFVKLAVRKYLTM